MNLSLVRFTLAPLHSKSCEDFALFTRANSQLKRCRITIPSLIMLFVNLKIMESNTVYELPELRITKQKSSFRKVQITSSSIAADTIRKFYNDDIELWESFFILLLDQGNNTIGFVKISQGGISGTVVDARLVAHYAVNSLACGLIMAHNHPSGTLRPSDTDKRLTAKIVKALDLFDIKVQDHIILTSEGYFSFCDEGILNT